MYRRFQFTSWLLRFAAVGIAAAAVSGCGSSSGGLTSGRLYVADTGNDRFSREDNFQGANWAAIGDTDIPGTSKNYLNLPGGAYHDSSGYFYIADTGNNRIVFSKTMSCTDWTVFGSLGAGVNQFNSPSGIFVDSANPPTVYVADTGNNRIVSFNVTVASNNSVTFSNWNTYGSAGSGNGQFDGPTSVFVDTASPPNIYVVDRGNNRVVEFSGMTGANWQSFGTAGSGNDQFLNPYGIFLDPSVGIYVTDSGNNRIVLIGNMSGSGWTAYGTGGIGVGNFMNPTGVFVNSAHQIYVADTNNGRIVEMNNIGGTGFTAGGGTGATPGYFSAPQGLFVY